jgi:hypothetical protein
MGGRGQNDEYGQCRFHATIPFQQELCLNLRRPLLAGPGPSWKMTERKSASDAA